MDSVARQTLGPYSLQAYLGGNALSSVYLATDGQPQNQVALRVLRPYLSRDTDVADQFLESMERVSHLDHPSVNKLHSSQSIDGECYVAMDYIPWETLRKHMSEQRSLQEALTILAQVAEALAYASENGVAHHNLRPTNIFLSPESKILVSDFGMGVLKTAYKNAMKVDLSSPMASYQAPEDTQGSPLDPYTDIYSLAVLSYEMLTGKLPFNAISPSTVLVRQLGSKPTEPTKLNPLLPPEADQVLLKALDHRPRNRFDKPMEFFDALQKALRSLPLNEPILPRPIELVEHGTSIRTSTKRQSPAERDFDSNSDGEMLQICPFCEEANEISAIYCISCWGRLIDTRLVEPKIAKQLERKRIQMRNRRRIMRIAFIASFPLFLVGAILNSIFNLPEPPPAALDHQINSESNPGDWAMLRGNASRTGFVSKTTFLPKGEVVWKFESEPVKSLTEGELEQFGGEPPNTPIFASPAIVDGVVFLPTGDRRVLALNAATGKVIWEHSISGPVSFSPAVTKDLVYVGLRDGRLLALDRHTGELNWSFDTKDPILSAPVVHEGTVYFSSIDGRVHAIDATTGTSRWTFKVSGRYPSTVAVNSAVVTFTASDNRLHILDRATGLEKLAYALVAPTHSTPAIQGNNVITTDIIGGIWAIDWSATQNHWQRRWYTFRFQMFLWGIIQEIEAPRGFVWDHKLDVRKDRFLNSSAVSDDKVIQCTVLGRCTALSSVTGEEFWRQNFESFGFSSPVIVGNVVYVGAQNGNAYGMDIDTGKLLWEFATGDQVTASPVFANGMLYVASQDGTLYAIR